MTEQPKHEEWPQAEAEKRRDDALRRALATPPKPKQESEAESEKKQKKDQD